MKIKNNIIEVMILVGIFALLFYSSNPVEHTDSIRYLNGSLLDPPMYSIIISILQTLFGTLKSVIMFQTLLIGLGIIYFVRTISRIFNLDYIIKFFVSFFLFIPIIQFYDYLLTEPVSYALSILFVSLSIKLIYKFNNKNLIWTTIFATALLLTRNQFIFLYPVILLFFLGIFILNNSNKSIGKLLILSFFVIFITHNSIIFLHTFKNQNFFDDKYVNKNDKWTESLTYVSLGPSYFLYIDAIYISNTKDVELFENQKLKKTLTKIFDEMNYRKSLSEYYNGRGHFSKSLTDIRDISNPLLLELAAQKKTGLSKLKREISITLISANFVKYLKLIFKKFYDSTWLFVFIPFFMLLAGFISFLNNKSKFSLVIIFLSIFTLSNHSVVYLFGRVQPRYLIYTDFILLVFILILFSVFLKKKNTI